jgi:hypothetical protein
MRSLAATGLLLCSMLALVPACSDDGGEPAPDASFDAMRPDAMPDAMGTGDVPDAGPPADAPEPPPDASPPALALILSTQAVSADEGEPAGAVFTVALSAAPAGPVTVTVAITSSNEAVAVVDRATLSFSTDDYDVGQVVRITAVDDADVEDETATITLAAEGLPAATVAATLVDDDTPTILADPTTVVVGEGGIDTFEVRLGAQPGASVIVSVSSGDPGAATVDPASLTFTAADYDQTQTVTVTGVDDADQTSEPLTLTLSAPGLSPVNIGGVVTDDDVPAPFPKFKISNASFADEFTFSVSAAAEVRIELGVSKTLQRAAGESNNTLLEITQQGVYLFEMLVNHPVAPVLTITRDPGLRAPGT